MKYLKNKINIRILLVLLFFLIGVLIHSNIFTLESKKSDIHNFKVSLQKKENIVEFWADSILQSAKKNELDIFLTRNSRILDRLYEEYGILLNLYNNNNECVLWTNNAIPLDVTLLSNNKSFLQLPNAEVCLLRKSIPNSYRILGVILIKTHYSYENKFIKNNFHKSFNLKTDIKITKGLVTDENAVINQDKEYLFTLKSEYHKNLHLSYTIVFILFSISFIILLFYVFSLFKTKKIPFGAYFIILLIVFSFRFYIQFILKPSFFTHIPLFQPKYFATSALFPSLGDLFITTVLMLVFLFVWVTKVKIPDISKFKYSYVFLWTTILHIHALFSVYILNCLIEDSSFNFELFNLTNLTIFSVISYFIIFITFLSYVMLVNRVVPVLKQYFYNYWPLLFVCIFSAIFIIICYFLFKKIDYFSYIFIFTLTLFWLYLSMQNTSRFAIVTIIISLFSIYVVIFINDKIFDKTFEETKVLAVNLAREKDPAAEIVIADLIQKCKKDTTIIKLLSPHTFNYNEFYKYFKNRYLGGYLRQYNLQLTICDRQDKLLVNQQNKDTYNCYSYFSQLIKNVGYKTETKNLYYLQNNMGLTNYLFVLKMWLPEYKERVKIFVELINKPNYEVLGYPELLLMDDNKQTTCQYLTKNFAKYSEGKLLAEVGDFPYAFDRSVYKHSEKEFDFFRYENYDHFIYNYNKNSIIISKPTVTFFNEVISFTYFLLFCLISLILLSLVVNKFNSIVDIKFTIKNKIALSTTSILAISMLFIAFATAIYTNSQFENKQYKLLREKIQSVLVELENRLPEINNLEQINSNDLNDLLIKFSNVFYTDINIYDLKGKLYATSRQEIFDRNLTGKMMNSIAYRELFVNKKARMVHKENIGKLQYYSAYIPFSNSKNELVAYLNLPYFSKEIELRQEISKVLVAIINLYAFLIIISIFVTIYLSEILIEPLRLVQQRISSIDLSKKNERIVYNSNDEIADLVAEYNRMLEALDKSARLLAKSERESAWREMAKQIAHEIKNPLTPMKLSIQLLNKAKQNNAPDFDKRLERTTNTLVEQIDSLSSIANTFSQFAKMPQLKLSKTNIIQPITLTAELFEEYKNITINIQNRVGDIAFVLAENERLVQIFNNLIKNAVQSIPKNKKGKIKLTIEEQQNNIIVGIKDNGKGIKDEIKNKLFEPNFTTKNSGTGLGLAIVKNIIKELNGDIYFESELNQGTTFFVKLPLIKE